MSVDSVVYSRKKIHLSLTCLFFNQILTFAAYIRIVNPSDRDVIRKLRVCFDFRRHRFVYGLLLVALGKLTSPRETVVDEGRSLFGRLGVRASDLFKRILLYLSSLVKLT